MQDGACLVTWQDGSECANCGERWSTAAQCNEADDRLMAMGWKARGMR